MIKQKRKTEFKVRWQTTIHDFELTEFNSVSVSESMTQSGGGGMRIKGAVQI